MSTRKRTQQTNTKAEDELLIKDGCISYEIVRELIKMHISDTNKLFSKIESQQRIIEKLKEELASINNEKLSV